jgi:hypothetical protein
MVVRPSTHPAEHYARQVAELTQQLEVTVRALAHLDPDEIHGAGDGLVETLEDAIAVVEGLLVVTPLPYPQDSLFR